MPEQFLVSGIFFKGGILKEQVYLFFLINHFSDENI